VCYQEPLGGKYLSRTILIELEPGVIGAITLSRRSLQPGQLHGPYAREKLGQRPQKKEFCTESSDPPP
jgi:hypothetical protein